MTQEKANKSAIHGSKKTSAAGCMTIAHWMENMSFPLASLEDWLALLGRQMAKAADAGADLLLIPEHTSEHWMHFAPADLLLTQEMEWMADQMAIALPRLQKLVDETGVALVAGSSSWAVGDGQFYNRVWALFPDRAAVFHDKLVMTPSEKDPESWDFALGGKLTVFTWRGFRIGLIICLDVEMPAVSHLLAAQDIDLLLVPSMTTRTSGYQRVYSCARARAVELMTAVAVVGNVGQSSHQGEIRDGFNSGAAVYVPSEEAFGSTGIFSDEPVHSGLGASKQDAEGKMLISRDIPLLAIRSVRHGKPEAWPGPFDAKHLKVEVE